MSGIRLVLVSVCSRWFDSCCYDAVVFEGSYWKADSRPRLLIRCLISGTWLSFRRSCRVTMCCGRSSGRRRVVKGQGFVVFGQVECTVAAESYG